MPDNTLFHTNTALAQGLRTLLRLVEDQLALDRPVNVYLAGGMAVHLYTANRVTTDVDAEFDARLFLPKNLMVDVVLENGTPEVIYLDTNYSPSFALMHEDYQDDALPLDIGTEKLHVHVLTPVDLAVSKIARLADSDREDIQALVQSGLTTADDIERRATSALVGYVGGQSMLLLNLRDAVALAREAEAQSNKRVGPDHDGDAPKP